MHSLQHTNALQQANRSLLHQQPAHGVDDDVTIGAFVANLNPTARASFETELAQREQILFTGRRALIDYDLCLSIGVMHDHRYIGSPIGQRTISQATWYLPVSFSSGA